MRRDAISRVIEAYDDWIIRAYCRGRFLILRQRFLDEIGQYLPEEGPVLDLGCGFGLFSLYYAQLLPRARFCGVDLDGHRIAIATEAARRLGLANATYAVGDAGEFRATEVHAAAYMLDIVHHVPPASVPPLLRALRRCLPPGGRLLVKDVDTRPAPKRWFTWLLDRAMAPATPVRYWSAEELTAALTTAGFQVRRHLMVDVLPYPHILYICEAR
jgi:cyclopropane fatty-acyl-phospholipid synthase-like methyltransferase